MTQKEQILNHLQDGKAITSLEAWQEYGISRLSNIIFKLRGEGYDIKSKLMKTMNRFGATCWVSKYVMEDEDDA